MDKLGFNRELSLLRNEHGAVMISNAIVSSLMVVMLVLFGETVTTCYQYISLQHALNEGLRAGILPNPVSETTDLYRKDVAQKMVYQTANNLAASNNNTNNTGIKRKAAFVFGRILRPTVTFNSSGSPAPDDNKWISIQIQKQLDYSSVLSLISGSSGSRIFKFDFVGKAKIRT
jgi:Flp pilus assembly protein TadG